MKKTIVFILLSIVIHCSTAWAEETMTWLVTNWPPLQILEGPDKGKGRYDAFMERIVMRQSDMEKLGNPESISLIDLLEVWERP